MAGKLNSKFDLRRVERRWELSGSTPDETGRGRPLLAHFSRSTTGLLQEPVLHSMSAICLIIKLMPNNDGLLLPADFVEKLFGSAIALLLEAFFQGMRAGALSRCRP